MRDHEAIGRVVAMQDDACADTGDRTPKEPRASARAVIVRRRRPTHAVRCSPPTRRAVPRRQATAEFHQETAPAEHAVYDAYGQATLYAWPSADVTGDGQVNIFDLVAVRGALSTISPLHDVNLDGAVDIFDLVSLRGQLDTSAVATTTSNVGNPYYFTGRLTDTLHASDLLAANDPHFRRLQDNRNRTYDPKHGRWLQRDPLGVRQETPRGAVTPTTQYTDGMSVYEYVRSQAANAVDPSGHKSLVYLECVGIEQGSGSSGPLGKIPLGAVGFKHCSVVTCCEETRQCVRLHTSGDRGDGMAEAHPENMERIDYPPSPGGWTRHGVLLPKEVVPKSGSCCQLFSCLRNAHRNSKPYKYDPVKGPNSNTYARCLLAQCGIEFKGYYECRYNSLPGRPPVECYWVTRPRGAQCWGAACPKNLFPPTSKGLPVM